LGRFYLCGNETQEKGLSIYDGPFSSYTVGTASVFGSQLLGE
jgi:hypothetical protein